MSRKWQESDEQADRERRHDPAPANAPQSMIIQQVPEWCHEPLLGHSLPFKGELLETIQENFLNSTYGPAGELSIGNKSSTERKVIGGVCPHAGYVFSGSAAAYTIQEIFREGAPDTIIILGTQHTGYYDIGIMKEGSWRTPFGDMTIDTELASLLLQESIF